MRRLFHPYLPNGLAGEPAVWIDVPDEAHAILLDAGHLRGIPNRKLLRTARVVVTHTHMDHFGGVDHLLRLCLRRQTELRLDGPAGFLANMQGKLDAYTWNLIEDYPLRIVARELDGETLRAMRYSGADGMRPTRLADEPFLGTLVATRSYRLNATLLDHGIPVLAVALDEREHLGVDKDRLRRLGLEAGPWIAELKQALRRADPPQTPIDVPAGAGPARRLELGRLAAEIIRRTPGQRLVYCTDFGYTAENREKLLQLAAGADLLICEASFLHADVELARRRHHLTARQTGELARAAGVARLAPFHISSRYHGREHELLDEAARAFGGPVIRLPRGPGAEHDGSGESGGSSDAIVRP